MLLLAIETKELATAYIDLIPGLLWLAVLLKVNPDTSGWYYWVKIGRLIPWVAATKVIGAEFELNPSAVAII